jgi:hypothetical protein
VKDEVLVMELEQL